jgi:hypothetical protein
MRKLCAGSNSAVSGNGLSFALGSSATRFYEYQVS